MKAKLGNIVEICATGHHGVVVELDHKNEAAGRSLNTRISRFNYQGEYANSLWYNDNEFIVIDEGKDGM